MREVFYIGLRHLIAICLLLPGYKILHILLGTPEEHFRHSDRLRQRPVVLDGVEEDHILLEGNGLVVVPFARDQMAAVKKDRKSKAPRASRTVNDSVVRDAVTTNLQLSKGT